MKNMGTVLMYLDAHTLFRVDISGNMVSFVNQQAAFTASVHLVCKTGSEKPGSHNQIIIMHGISPSLFCFVFLNLYKVVHQSKDLVPAFLVQLYVILHYAVFEKLLADGSVSFQRTEVYRIQVKLVAHFDNGTVGHPINASFQCRHQCAVRDLHF